MFSLEKKAPKGEVEILKFWEDGMGYFCGSQNITRAGVGAIDGRVL